MHHQNTHLSRRSLLAGGCATLGALTLASPSSAAALGARKNLIVAVAQGGWDPTFALDPKVGLPTIDAPEGEIQELSGIPILTDPARAGVTDFFTDFGAITAVINGIHTQSISHTAGMLRILTGSSMASSPDIGTIAAFEGGLDLGAPYLVLGSAAFSGPYPSVVTRTGTVNQLGTLLQPEIGFPLEDGTFGFQRYFPLATENDLIAQHRLARAHQEIALRGTLGRNGERLNDYVESIDRAQNLREIGALQGFNATQELSFQIDLAVDAIATGMSAAVQIELGGWDTHVNNADQGPLWHAFFTELHRLVAGLEQRGILDDTVIVVLSEMGRTPLLNVAAGKDHWPVTSALVIGTGVRGGRTIGGTDDAQLGLPVDLATGDRSDAGVQIRHGNLAAGILELVGIDPEVYLPSAPPLRGLALT